MLWEERAGKNKFSAVRSVAVLTLGILYVTLAAQAANLPPDVAGYVARRDRCDHWRGEASPDPGRAAEIDRAVARECRGSDAALARLLRRHARNPTVMRRLNDYDLRIER